MLFNFALFPLGETIIDRLEPDGKHSSLCWYNLTDGWYWIEADTAQLFRYTPEWMALWSAQDPCPVHWPYVDYQVVRLWEDLLEILPKVMEPLPPALAQRLATPFAWNEWMADFQGWTQLREDEDEEDEDGSYAATKWWFQRQLDTRYLVEGPYIWVWNDGTHIHLVWDNRERLLEGVPLWTATTGEVLIPVAEFLEEVITFDTRLIKAMANRVSAAREHWAQPSNQEAVRGLSKEQLQRAEVLAPILEAMATQKPTDWERVMAALSQAEHNSAFLTWRVQHGQ